MSTSSSPVSKTSTRGTNVRPLEMGCVWVISLAWVLTKAVLFSLMVHDLLLLGLDGNLPRFCGLGFRQFDGEHAAFEVRLDLVRIDLHGQRHYAGKVAKATLLS